MLFVCYPKCSTCMKAKKHLNQLGLSFEERDISRENPTAEELERWFAGLHDDPDATGRSGTICKEYVLQHKGATARIMDEICR